MTRYRLFAYDTHKQAREGLIRELNEHPGSFAKFSQMKVTVPSGETHLHLSFNSQFDIDRLRGLRLIDFHLMGQHIPVSCIQAMKESVR